MKAKRKGALPHFHLERARTRLRVAASRIVARIGALREPGEHWAYAVVAATLALAVVA